MKHGIQCLILSGLQKTWVIVQLRPHIGEYYLLDLGLSNEGKENKLVLMVKFK